MKPYNITRRIGNDQYQRPRRTITEKLTLDEIENKLEDYVPIPDIYKVPLGTHLRYFSIKKNMNGEKIRLFRMGGMLNKNKGLPDYVVLSNGKSSWCVQVKTTEFYRKMTFQEIKDEYEETIDDYKNENDKLKIKIAQLTNMIRRHPPSGRY